MRTTCVLSITLPSPLLDEARSLARQENRTMSELMREALRQYQQKKRWETVANLGRAAALSNEQDVVDLIHQFRREQRQRKTVRPAKSRKSA